MKDLRGLPWHLTWLFSAGFEKCVSMYRLKTTLHYQVMHELDRRFKSLNFTNYVPTKKSTYRKYIFGWAIVSVSNALLKAKVGNTELDALKWIMGVYLVFLKCPF